MANNIKKDDWHVNEIFKAWLVIALNSLCYIGLLRWDTNETKNPNVIKQEMLWFYITLILSHE